MRIIAEVIKDIKTDENNAYKDIQKALMYKNENKNLAEKYYMRSVRYLENAKILHEEIVNIINAYNKEKGEPPIYMKNIWDWEHKQIIDSIAETKVLQNEFKS